MERHADLALLDLIDAFSVRSIDWGNEKLLNSELFLILAQRRGNFFLPAVVSTKSELLRDFSSVMPGVRSRDLSATSSNQTINERIYPFAGAAADHSQGARRRCPGRLLFRFRPHSDSLDDRTDDCCCDTQPDRCAHARGPL
jgi:hypothetical protein